MKKIKLKLLDRFKKINTTLSRLYLKNFKGFYDQTEVNFKPKINLIFGKNSSGKSSILQAIRLFNQSNSNQYFTPFNPIANDRDSGINFDTEYKEIISNQNIKNDLTIGVDFTRRQKDISLTAGLKYCYQFKKNFFPKDFPKKSEVILKELTVSKKKDYEDNKHRSHHLGIKSSLTKTNFLNIKSEEFKLLEYDRDNRNREPILSGSFQPYYYDLNTEAKNIDSQYFEKIYDKFQVINIDYKNAILDILKKISEKSTSNKTSLEILKNVKNNKEKNFLLDFAAKFHEERNLANKINEIKKKYSNSKDIIREINKIKNIYDFFEIFFGYASKENIINSHSLLTYLKSKESKNKNNFVQYFKNDFIYKFSKLKFYKGRFKNINTKFNDRFTNWENSGKYKINMLIELLNLYEVDPKLKLEHFSMENIFMEDLIKNGLSKIKAIQITNSLPERFNITNIRKDYVGWNSENMVDLLSRKKNIDQINSWFKTLKVDYSIKIRPEGNYFNIVFVPNNKKFEIKRTHVGQGYSVFLPLIIDCLTAENKIFLCEEPEIHLHPKLQADIIELIVTSATSRNNQFIFETHSEDFLLRVLKLIRKGVLSNKDVSINYITKIKNKSIVKEVKIDEKGRYTTSWKDNIFAERLEELS